MTRFTLIDPKYMATSVPKNDILPKVIVGRGDTAEPVLTILLTWEN